MNHDHHQDHHHGHHHQEHHHHGHHHHPNPVGLAIAGLIVYELWIKPRTPEEEKLRRESVLRSLDRRIARGEERRKCAQRQQEEKQQAKGLAAVARQKAITEGTLNFFEAIGNLVDRCTRWMG